MGGGGIFGLIALVLIIVPLWQIWKRTGHSPWWSLTAIIPLFLIAQLWVLAFKSWPSADTKGM